MFKIKLTLNPGQPDEKICFFGDSIGPAITYTSREAAEGIAELNRQLIAEDLAIEVVEIIEEKCHT